MNTTTKNIIGAAAALALVGVIYVSAKTDAPQMREAEKMAESTDMDMKKEERMKANDMKDGMKDDGMKDDMMDDGSMMDDSKDMDSAMMKGSYEAYAPEKIARAETGDVVLFFHASWCPSCRVLGSDIEKNVASIPAGVTILKVDYDKEAELKKKYGVTYQHTLVQVAADGSMITKWSGGATLATVLEKIQ